MAGDSCCTAAAVVAAAAAAVDFVAVVAAHSQGLQRHLKTYKHHYYIYATGQHTHCITVYTLLARITNLWLTAICILTQLQGSK